MIRKIGLAAAGLALVTGIGVAIAQEGPAHRKPLEPKAMEARKDLIDQIKKFARAEILPQMGAWKSQLDRGMSAEDLQSLNALRARASALQARAIDAGKGMRDAWKGENYDALKADRQKMKDIVSERDKLFQDLVPLAEKYRPLLETIGADARPKLEDWKSRGIAIFQKWSADHKDELSGMRGMGHMMGGLGGFMGPMGRGDHQKMMVARFMLWDGNDPIDKMEQLGQSGIEGPGGINLK
jgi:hypothetical protein